MKCILQSSSTLNTTRWFIKSIITAILQAFIAFNLSVISNKIMTKKLYSLFLGVLILQHCLISRIFSKYHKKQFFFKEEFHVCNLLLRNYKCKVLQINPSKTECSLSLIFLTIFSGILKDKTMNDNLMYIPIDAKQKYSKFQG